MPTEVDRITREHVEAFIADQLERWKPTTAQVRYGGLRQFFKWAVDDGEIKVSPMANMGPPTIPDVPVPMVSDDDLKKLLKACEGNSSSNSVTPRSCAYSSTAAQGSPK